MSAPDHDAPDLIEAPNPRITLEEELFKVEGVAICLERLSRDGPGEDEYRYLGFRLMEHFKAAYRAFEEIEGASAIAEAKGKAAA